MKDIITQIADAKQYQDLRPSDLIVDLVTSGRYWRTSQIKNLSMVYRDASDQILLRVLTVEKESDEYELLNASSEPLKAASRIFTFNGRAFDLPHLHRKYSAYGLKDPLEIKDYVDLFLILKPLSTLFPLAGRKLDDYLLWLEPDGSHFENDAAKTLRILPLQNYLSVLETGKKKETSASLLLLSAEKEENGIAYRVLTPCDFPKNATAVDNLFSLSFKGKELRFLLPVENNKIRIYHSDIRNYEYLPFEGYAVHKSMSAFVDRSRKEKATRETCFHYAAFSESLMTDSDAFRTVLSSVCSYSLPD